MAIIDPNLDHVVLINTFTVKPGQADELVRVLADATSQSIQHVPGFISASLHVSLDRTKVVNYAQWRSKEDFERMRSSDSVKQHTKGVEPLVEGFEPVLYELRFSHARQLSAASA